MKFRTHWCIAVVAIGVAMASVSQAAVLADFQRVYSDDLAVSGFVLESKQTLDISATTFANRSSGSNFIMTNAWILNSDTREVVWNLVSERDKWKTREITTENYSVELPAGKYEVYYSTWIQTRERRWKFGNDWGGGWFRKGPHDIVEDVLDDENVDDIDDLYEKFGFKIEGNGRVADARAVEAWQDAFAKDAILSIRQVRDHERIEMGFELKRPTTLRVLTIGEAREDGHYDYGWIMNVENRSRVWEFDYDESDRAGGASKNRMIDAEFEAPAGRYVAVYVTDGSHSWRRWNSAPPYDPEFWGLTIIPTDGSGKSNVSLFDYKAEKMKNVVVSITEVGDSEFQKRGFTLKKDMPLRIYAIGEGRDGEMYDYGWIVNADTRERFWDMDFYDTEHAGGAEKNRVFDEVVNFPKGDYLVYYATDGSHSFTDWNADPPSDRDYWGITLVGTGDFNKKDVSEYHDTGEASDALVMITEIGDDEYVSKSFELKKDSDVRIIAIGEGVDGRMYDYGWIEEEGTGRVVWEMTYRKTRHAGGAKKNRMFADTIRLKAGKYKVFYESDDSHSFGHWNASRPFEPENWGICVRLTK